MSKILSIGTAVPKYRHKQQEIVEFTAHACALNQEEKRKLRYLYKQSGIEYRYSVLPDFSLPAGQWQFFPPCEGLEPFPAIEMRMKTFRKYAVPLCLQAITECLKGLESFEVTHLITVSCTGMSAPGLDLEIMEELNLPASTWRTSVNFMGCYAAIHALKIADAICKATTGANVLIVCVELCTIHFQKEYTSDNSAAGLLFADGAAAALVTGNSSLNGMDIEGFYSTVSRQGKHEMVWELSSSGFQLSLGAYIPDLVEQDFSGFVNNALREVGVQEKDLTHWCIHPGGKKILQAVQSSMHLSDAQLKYCYDVLNDYGNMSSPTVLFVLKRIQLSLHKNECSKIFGAAFGPGLTMETFILST